MKYNKILLVDDDALFRNIHNRMLLKADFAHEIELFNNASSALDYLKAGFNTHHFTCPEIIFLDINLPDMDGWQFMDELSLLCKPVTLCPKIIMLSASAYNSDQQKAASYNMVADYLLKPLSLPKLELLHKKLIAKNN